MTRCNRRDAIRGMACGAVAAGVGPAAAAVAATPSPANAAGATRWPAVDALVCGGGPAGIAAAMMAAETGAKTLLVERYGRLGGMAVQAMVGPLMGHVKSPRVEAILDHVGGRCVDYEFIDLKYAELVQQAGAEVLLHAWCDRPLVEKGRVVGARLVTKQGPVDVPAAVTVDATGDGDVAFAAGAPFEQGREAGPNWEADGLVQPMTIMFRVSGVDHAQSMDARGGRGRYRFPNGQTWNELTKAANARGELPANVGMVRTYMGPRKDQRVINATQINGVDGVNVRDLTRAELEGRRQVSVVMEFLRRYAPGFQEAYVSGMPAVIGVRETRRICGLKRLEAENILEGTRFDTAVVRGASFPIDIHNPAGIGQAQGVSKEHPLGRDPRGKPYDIPYECLVPRGVDGLLTAGRCISGSHEAMASYRVQVIAMATGLAAGAAAAIAARERVAPREVGAAKVQQIVFDEAPPQRRPA